MGQSSHYLMRLETHYPKRVEAPPPFEIPHPDVMLIEAERRDKGATIQLVRYNFIEPPDHPLFYSDRYRLELALTQRPKNSRACYEDSWRMDQFEQIGSIFLVPPGRRVHAKSDGAGVSQVVLCEIEPATLNQWLEADLEWNENRLAACLDIHQPEVHHLLLRLADEMKHPGFASESLVELITGQLSIEIARFCNAVPESETLGVLNPRRLKLIDERLREDSASPTLTELAELCGLSVRQLARAFKNSRGCSLGAYVANYRIERAKSLLVGNLSVKAIACTVGFSSTASFCYAFRRVTGLTPGEFRQRMR